MRKRVEHGNVVEGFKQLLKAEGALVRRGLRPTQVLVVGSRGRRERSMTDRFGLTEKSGLLMTAIGTTENRKGGSNPQCWGGVCGV